MIYLVSDTHFYHKNIIEYCHRPFKHIGEDGRTDSVFIVFLDD